MSNRISGYNASEPLAPPKGAGNATQADKAQGESASVTAAATPSAASTADQLTLTGSARTLQKLGEAIASAPVVNTQKVAALKISVQNGTYKIDAGRVAGKILQFESGLQ